MSLFRVAMSDETYMGETFRLEKREIQSFSARRGFVIVWCWEILTGPGKGSYGGKCATKEEARRVAKRAIKADAAEAKAQVLSREVEQYDRAL